MNRILLGAILALGFLINPSAKAFASGDDEASAGSDRYGIHVLIMGPNEELFARFGHIALVVEDKKLRTKKIYNFGTFDFSDPDLQVKYVRGFLNYWLSIGSYRQTILRYKHFDRELIERTINLSPEQASMVAKKLEINALPENRTYAYRHYLDNCCTRIRDILDDVTGGAITKGRDQDVTGRTFRDYTREALRGMPVMSTLILFSLGPAVDQPITRKAEQFLPSVLAEDLDTTSLGAGDEPLVSKKRVLVKRSGSEVGTSPPTEDIVIAFLLFALVAVGLILPAALGNRAFQSRLLGLGLVVWGLVAGLGGVALLLYWIATTHYDTHFNENMLSYLITHLWLLGPGFKLLFKGRIKERTAKILKWYALAAIGLIAIDVALKLGPFIQNNWGFIAFATICNAAVYIAFRRGVGYSH